MLLILFEKKSGAGDAVQLIEGLLGCWGCGGVMQRCINLWRGCPMIPALCRWWREDHECKVTLCYGASLACIKTVLKKIKFYFTKLIHVHSSRFQIILKDVYQNIAIYPFHQFIFPEPGVVGVSYYACLLVVVMLLFKTRSHDVSPGGPELSI